MLIHTETEREREIERESEGRVYESNFEKSKLMRQILLKYIHICIKFLMYKILLWQLKLSSTVCIFAIKIKFLKNIKNILYFGKEATSILSIFKLFYYPPPLLFPFLAIPDFIEEVD